MALQDIEEQSPERLIAGLKALLDVGEVGSDLYLGQRLPGGRGRVFGGQVIGQALMAASRSVTGGKVPHSLHAYFMRPGDEDYPIHYRIERDFDGRSFATRRVVALQKDAPILSMAASFHLPEEGFSHQVAMPDVPAPETLTDESQFWRENAARIPEKARAHMLRPRPIQIRSIGDPTLLDPRKSPPANHFWFRAAAPVGEDGNMHRAILGYASDMRLLGTGLLPHGVSWLTRKLQMASLDHAIWFHEAFSVDEWLLFSMDSPWSGGGRGFNRGLIFTQDGRLVASVSQEGLMRDREQKA